MTELKPCPAGHENPRICQEHLTTRRDGFGVTCRTKDCGWEVAPIYDDIDTAAAAWNTRPEEDRLRARIVELELQIERMEDQAAWTRELEQMRERDE